MLPSRQPNSVQRETYIRGNNDKKKIKQADFPTEAPQDRGFIDWLGELNDFEWRKVGEVFTGKIIPEVRTPGDGDGPFELPYCLRAWLSRKPG